ncbi:PREDICTED: protein FRG2-like-1 [Galeopterus variegatus]|uniref:Protein FRG2-like-1 n=1 Tax=Galeopterus variegatus TaxID=482537 RepID=A0ABM0SAT6_GALVR|nr:PREDICTED: protein FRG2-like-1 [Galeopterus variegatus]
MLKSVQGLKYFWHCTDQPSFQQLSFKERGSEEEEKSSEEKRKTLSLHSSENCTQRRGPELNVNEEENSKETELNAGNSIDRSESESSSDGRKSRKRKISSKDSCQDGTGNCLEDEHSLTSEKKPKASDPVNFRKIEETYDVHSWELQGAHTGHSKKPRFGSLRHHPPPLRKSLVAFLRAMCEAIYQDIAQVQAQQIHSPLTKEQLSDLAQLRGSLCTAVQTLYAMATQAAYVFPAEGWLIPAPEHGPGDSSLDGKAPSFS